MSTARFSCGEKYDLVGSEQPGQQGNGCYAVLSGDENQCAVCQAFFLNPNLYPQRVRLDTLAGGRETSVTTVL